MHLDYLHLGPRELRSERRQLMDAGRPAGDITEELDGLASDMETNGRASHQEQARSLLDQCTALPEGHDGEPNGLADIRAARPTGPRSVPVGDVDLRDRFAGAWLGRCAGCRLGKPVETWTRTEIRRFLDTTKQSLDGYLRADVPENEEFSVDATGGWDDRIEGMPRDDDIDFTVAALTTLEREGIDFTSEDLARTWIEQLPACKLHTAERVAYRNLLNGVGPPESAYRYNPCREFIGAQIRGDCYGYVFLGHPERAAERAHRDAVVSHTANGIYGGMWVAAMLAAVPRSEEFCEAIRIGLTELPEHSRFAEAIQMVLQWRDAALDFEAAIDRIHDEWDDSDFYEGYHVLPNAQVVAATLAWFDNDDLGTALTRAVGAGFDTDCNAATVGSAVGLHLGRDALADQWIAPIEGTIRTALADRPRPTIDALVTTTMDIAETM